MKIKAVLTYKSQYENYILNIKPYILCKTPTKAYVTLSVFTIAIHKFQNVTSNLILQYLDVELVELFQLQLEA